MLYQIISEKKIGNTTYIVNPTSPIFAAYTGYNRNSNYKTEFEITKKLGL